MAAKVLKLIVSDDDFIAANRARELFEEESETVSDEMSLEIVDAAAGKTDEAVDACKRIVSGAATMPLFGGKKVVWARNVNFLGDSPVSKSDAVKEAVADMARALEEMSGDNAVVVMNASPVNRVNKTLKTLAAIADFEDYKTKDSENACTDLLKMEAKKLGVRFEGASAETLSGIVANNTRMALQELKKLAVYVNFERPISERDVIEMVPIFGEGDFFGMANAFYSGDVEKALGALRRYFFTNKTASARPIITVLQKQNSILIQIRALMDSKILPRTTSPQPKGAVANAAEMFGEFYEGSKPKTPYNLFTQNEWYAGSKLAPVAARFTLKRLIDIQMNLVRAFEDLISRPGNDEPIMREFFIRSLSVSQ